MNAFRFLSLVGAALLLASCGPPTRDRDCQPSCGRRSCGSDGCGGSCGRCASGTCGSDGQCVTGGCEAESDAAFCQRLGKNCDTVVGSDNCGASRTAACGVCPWGEVCGGDGVENVCASAPCVPESDAQLCADYGKNCGRTTLLDHCRNSRTVDCGTCSGGQTCGTFNVCQGSGCTAESDAAFCSRLGKNCGSVSASDNCGRSRTAGCGSCSGGQSCGGGGIAGVCGAPACTAESDAAFCSRHGKNCGSISASDNCGTTRTASCGTCSVGRSCGGRGTANVCECASAACLRWTGVPGGMTGPEAIWGTSASNVWAVGRDGNIDHFDGTRWSPSDTVFYDLFAVWGSGPSNVRAVGSNSVAAQFNGSSWTRSGGAATSPTYYGIWGSGANDVWMVGSSTRLYRWDGSSWLQYANPTSEPLFAVWGSGANDVWAVGEFGTALHWTGSAWTKVSVGDAAAILSVWGSGANDVWITTMNGDEARHWDGSAWSPAPLPLHCYLYALWGSGPNDVWAVGNDTTNHGVVLHWNGTAWTKVEFGTLPVLQAVWGSSANDVWIVGDSGTYLHGTP